MNEANVDLVGAGSVSTVLRQTGFHKFQIIRRNLSKMYTPVFECLECKTVEGAAKAFENWANTLQSSNPNNSNEYEIIAWKDGDAVPEADDETKTPLRHWKNKVRFSFVLNANSQINQQVLNGAPQIIQAPVPATSKEEIAEMVRNASELLLLKYQNTELQKKVKDLEDELDEIGDDDEEKPNDLLATLGSIIALGKSKKEEPSGSLAGVSTQQEKIERIQKAVVSLSQYDKDLHIHLEKLASIAKNQPDTFKMLISMLSQY